MKGKHICKAPGCNAQVYSNGYCNKHRMQIYKFGRLRPDIEKFKRSMDSKCKEVDCYATPYKEGYCKVHYLLKYGNAIPRGIDGIANKCSEDNCYALKFHDGYCKNHYRQKSKLLVNG